MTDVTTPTTAPGDERLAHRGVFQQALVRPEIGAIIGAIGIWVFFWAVSVPFGTASGAQNILDQASTLGIMAVAVSMLMIGGEFDLSSGANTGAMGILIIFLVKETGTLGGAGFPIWLGLILSFGVAMVIGWVNGFMVDRTQLPSFIVTLGTYFVLIGLKLGLSKRLVDKIEMGRMDQGQGYSFWRKIFAGDWQRLTHSFDGRDVVYTVCLLAGFALVTFAVYEMHFAARDALNGAGLSTLGLGGFGVIAGVVTMHLTDATAGTVVGAVLIAVGGLAAAAGLGMWRYRPLGDRGSIHLTPSIVQPAATGLALIAVGLVLAVVMDSDNVANFIFPFTRQGLRATLVGLALLGGATFLFIAASRARRVNMATKAAVSLITAAVIVISAFVLQGQSGSYKFRAEAFAVLLIVALCLVAWAVAGTMFAERTGADPPPGRAANRAMAAGLLVGAAGLVVKTMFVTGDELERGITPANFSMRIVWFAGFTAVMVWVLGRTRFGSWTFAVGGNAQAARQVGVPAARTKTRLFMLVAGAAWLVGVLIAFRINAIQANQGNGEEFTYIIAAVVGGTLLTGGYGTALGGAIGALVMSMAVLGIPASRWESDWRFLFQGVILLTAVIANRFIRDKAEAMRR
ncbi:MAG: ABC transporter permease [Desertimonas sp.]